MAINFSNGAILSESGGHITAPGRLVQMVSTVFTNTVNVATTSATDMYTSNPITMSNASNRLLIEFYCNTRKASLGDSVWSLCFVDLVHVQSGGALSYSGYIGDYTQTIRYTNRIASHAPGTVGPHSYKIRGWNYVQGNTNFGGTSQSGTSDSAHIRIMEYAV